VWYNGNVAWRRYVKHFPAPYIISKGGGYGTAVFNREELCDEEGGWQIELAGTKGYSHWKQWEDGGRILEHEPIE